MEIVTPVNGSTQYGLKTAIKAFSAWRWLALEVRAGFLLVLPTLKTAGGGGGLHCNVRHMQDASGRGPVRACQRAAPVAALGAASVTVLCLFLILQWGLLALAGLGRWSCACFPGNKVEDSVHEGKRNHIWRMWRLCLVVLAGQNTLLLTLVVVTGSQALYWLKTGLS